jgi:hypothetical protein
MVEVSTMMAVNTLDSAPVDSSMGSIYMDG